MLGLPLNFDHCVMIDKEPKILAYLMQRWGHTNSHMMDSMACVVSGKLQVCGYDYNHGGDITIQIPHSDILVAGTPCPPFSLQSRKSQRPECHIDHGVTFGGGAEACCEEVGLLAVVKEHRPGVLVLENVKGFNMRRKVGCYAHQTPLEVLWQELQKITYEGKVWFTGYVKMELDAEIWLGVQRKRCVVVSGAGWVSKGNEDECAFGTLALQ